MCAAEPCGLVCLDAQLVVSAVHRREREAADVVLLELEDVVSSGHVLFGVWKGGGLATTHAESATYHDVDQHTHLGVGAVLAVLLDVGAVVDWSVCAFTQNQHI